MTSCGVVACFLFVIYISSSNAQVPPRLQIPGAVLVGGPPQRPQQFRQARLLDAGPGPLPVQSAPRYRRPPIQNSVPLALKEVRPVVEEPEELPGPQISNFDNEVNKLGISVLQSAVREAVSAEEEDLPPPVQFRPQKPVPLLRENIRENLPPRPVARPAPVLRTEVVQRPILRPEPLPVARGPIFRGDVPQRQVKQQEFREDLPVIRQPQPIRQTVRQPQPIQQYRSANKIGPRPVSYDDEDNGRKRKPVVQILRKYRNDNPDGSITWGFENEDGTFKEETLGIDCVTRGKYGYVDPDGVKREYNYETGNKCDTPQEEDELLPLEKYVPVPKPRKPLPPQFRPQPGLQYNN